MRRVFPRPGMSIAIFLLWMTLANTASLGTMLLGGLLALGLPFLVLSFWPDAPRLAHPAMALSFITRVAIDIMVANWAVARRVIGSSHRLNPVFVEVPLDVRDPFVATILASVVSLTPGTVSIDIDREHWVLYLHALDAPDPEALAREIKQRYEAPIREMFEC